MGRNNCLRSVGRCREGEGEEMRSSPCSPHPCPYLQGSLICNDGEPCERVN